MELKIYKNPDYYDNDAIVWIENGKEFGKGYQGKNDKRNHITHCPKCEKENYVMAVSSGLCAWCNFNSNHKL